jgi:hypothetical protein
MCTEKPHCDPCEIADAQAHNKHGANALLIARTIAMDPDSDMGA